MNAAQVHLVAAPVAMQRKALPVGNPSTASPASHKTISDGSLLEVVLGAGARKHVVHTVSRFFSLAVRPAGAMRLLLGRPEGVPRTEEGGIMHTLTQEDFGGRAEK